MTATSFFPAKPLGCYGDGGAVLTDDDALADLLRSLRMHGQGSDHYDNVRIGLASRLDTIQAAVLREKLKIFPDEIAARNAIARRYADGLRDVAIVPRVPDGATSVWAQYTIRVTGGRRDALRRRAQGRGHPDRDLLPDPAAPPAGLQALSGRRRRRRRQRAPGRTRSSACRCTPISTKRRRRASSTPCAAFSGPRRSEADILAAAANLKYRPLPLWREMQ